jgi:CRP-like cAMP-binding protein
MGRISSNRHTKYIAVVQTQFESLGSAQDYATDIHEIFSNAPLFEQLDLAETTLLCSFMAVCSAHKNTVLMRQGDSSDQMIILLTGAALAVRDDTDGTRTTLHYLKPGESFGELAMLDGALLRASCVSTEPVDFVLISRQAFRDVLITLPRLGNKLLMLFLHVVSQRLLAAESHLPTHDLKY